MFKEILERVLIAIPGVLIVGMFIILFCGCSRSDADNITGVSEVEFVRIGDNGYDDYPLYYDTTTDIVYIISYHRQTAYYAPNGLPYKYNPETNELEEIDILSYITPEG